MTNLKTTSCSTGASVVGLGYDPQGNVVNKNGQGYVFDIGNRLRAATGKETYSYDGNGRRVLAQVAGAGNLVSMYGQDGVLRYQRDERTTRDLNYVYLAGSLVAVRDSLYAPTLTHRFRYQHTDALGTPVAVTDESRNVVERNTYEPYGARIGGVVANGVGYTGHVMDKETGLTYMQQRYYDPMIGRFLSVDPVTANSGTGSNFNRYWYANDNPYRFTDPDGRESLEEKRKKKEARDRVEKSDIIFYHVATVRAPASTGAKENPTDGIATMSGKEIRKFGRSTNFEACADFCPYKAEDGTDWYEAKVTSNRSYSWCKTGSCESGVERAGWTHGHPPKNFIGRPYDALFNSKVKVGFVNFTDGDSLSEQDRDIFNVYLILQNGGWLNLLNGQERSGK